MPYSHKRSPEKRKERKEKWISFEQRKKEADTIRGIVKDLNPRDLLTGEIIYSAKSEPILKEALAIGTYVIVDWRGEKKEIFFDSDRVEQIACHDFGEVLNRAIEPCWWR